MINFESLVYIKRYKTNIILVYSGQIKPITPTMNQIKFYRWYQKWIAVQNIVTFKKNRSLKILHHNFKKDFYGFV